MLAAPSMAASSGRQPDIVVEGPFEGQFGEWIVDQDDAAEVIIYRSSLVVAALSVAAAASMALLPGVLGTSDAPSWAFDASAAAFFASFGVSLSTIHIYMKPMHNFLKALWAAGALGAVLVLAVSPSHSLVVESFEVHHDACVRCLNPARMCKGLSRNLTAQKSRRPATELGTSVTETRAPAGVGLGVCRPHWTVLQGICLLSEMGGLSSVCHSPYSHG
jgi:hypothetical protein